MVPNNPKLEITQMFFSREWGNTVEHPQNGTPLSNEEQKDQPTQRHGYASKPSTIF